MSERLKAYSLSFMIHSSLLFFVFLFGRSVEDMKEKRILEIDLSLAQVELQRELVEKRKSQKKQVFQTLEETATQGHRQEVEEIKTPELQAQQVKLQKEDPKNPVHQVSEIKTQQVKVQQEEKVQKTTEPQAQHVSIQEGAKESVPVALGQVEEKESYGKASPQGRTGSEGKTNAEKESSGKEVLAQDGTIGEGKTTTGKEDSGKGASAQEGTGHVSLEEAYIRGNLGVITKIVQRHINYPMMARRMGWEGRVLVGFVLSTSGEVKDLRVLKSSGFDILDREALEGVKKSHRELPKPSVDVFIKLPVVFKLD